VSASTPSPPRGKRLSLLVLALVALIGATSIYAVLGVALQPAPSPRIEPISAGPALTKHVLLFIVDGLRYDVATNPKRMPHFVAAMKKHSSGLIWAGRISMSSSAVLAYGTGQWGQLEQLALNMFSQRPSFNSWLENGARNHGLTLDMVGDVNWIQMYRDHLSELRPDPHGVAMEFDMNPQNFADIRELLKRSPSFLVAQLTTPDHQGHVHGIPSPAYGAHIRAFDKLLHELLQELGPQWTVIVTSDHGATDTGTHGSDTPVQRQSPIYAYGPGIVPGVKLQRELEQIELGNTIATLLGAELPAHSQGHVLVEWLDYTPQQRGGVACAEARRAGNYAKAKLDELSYGQRAARICGTAETDDRAAVKESRALVKEVGVKIAATTGLGSTKLWIFIAIVALLTLLLIFVVYRRASLPVLPWGIALILVGLVLILYTERLSGNLPNTVRASLFAIANLITVAALLIPGRLTDLFDKYPRTAAMAVPGFLLASYTANTQVQSFVVVVAATIFFGLSGHLARGRSSILTTAKAHVGWWRLAGAAVLLALLYPPGVRKAQLWGVWLIRHAEVMLAASVAAVVIWSVGRALRRHAKNNQRQRAEDNLALLIGLPVILAAIVLRRFATPMGGRLLFTLIVATALVLALRRRRSLALHFGVASYALLLSRDIQMVPMLATIGIAELVGDSLGAPADEDTKARPATLLIIVTFCFSLFWVQRIALQGGLDIGDFLPALTFSDSGPPWSVVAVGVTARWLIPALMTVALLTHRQLEPHRITALKALTIACTLRLLMVLLTLAVCGQSFWTALRCTGELPFTLLYAVAAALMWVYVDRAGGRDAIPSGQTAG